jgi:hypothetical protein
MNREISTSDLRSTERIFVAAMQRLGFGRFESIRIDHGELILDPWPVTVRGVKFACDHLLVSLPTDEFQLKQQVIELLEYVRAVHAGEIRCLEVRHGLPFSMEVEDRHDINGGARG